jgi:hypothetical protein
MRYALHDKQKLRHIWLKKELSLIISKSSQQFRDRKEERGSRKCSCCKKIVLMKAKSGDCENNNYMPSVRAAESRSTVLLYFVFLYVGTEKVSYVGTEKVSLLN